MSARYDAPRRLQKCCAKIQPQSADLSEKSVPLEGKTKRTSIGGVLHGMGTLVRRGEKGVIRKTVKKRDFLHDLEN